MKRQGPTDRQTDRPGTQLRSFRAQFAKIKRHFPADGRKMVKGRGGIQSGAHHGRRKGLMGELARGSG